MKVVSIGMGQKIFEKGSPVRERMIEYGKIFEELHMVVYTPTSSKFEIENLSSSVHLYPTQSSSKIGYFFDYLKVVGTILKKIGKENVVVTVQDPFELGLIGLFLKFKYKLPLQVQIHTDFANRYFIGHSILNLLRFPVGLFVLSFADSVRVVSERIAKSISSLGHNISVLPINTELNSSYDRERSVNKQDESINFLTVARLEKEKNLETAITAFKKVHNQFKDSTFTIVGEGSQRKKLEDLSKGLGLEGKVKFVGWQNDLAGYYKNADAYISTSLYEGYGMSMVEAASFGLPLIATPAGVAGVLFKEGESTLISKQGDVESLTKSLLKIASSKDLRVKMGKVAREEFEKIQISNEEYLNRFQKSMKDALDFYQKGYGIFRKNILMRYLVAGLIGASTNIGLTYFFTDVTNIWYLYSSTLSFLISIAVSFTLQKFWTFGDGEMEKIHHQFAKYLATAAVGLFINASLMFLLVDLMGVWYLLAQIITNAFIAVFNFLMYKFFIFNK